MTQGHDEYNKFVILNLAENPIVTHPIAPEP